MGVFQLDYNVHCKHVPRACTHLPTRTMCIKQQWPVRSFTAAGFWKWNPTHLGLGAMLTAPPQAFLLPYRSGSHFRFSLLFGQAIRASGSAWIMVLAVLLWALLLAFCLHPFRWDPGGAIRTSESLLYCNSPLLHCKADMAHRFICNLSDRFWNFPLHCSWSCHAKYAMKKSPSTNISRPQDVTLCFIGLAKRVAKAARDALLAAVPFLW